MANDRRPILAAVCLLCLVLSSNCFPSITREDIETRRLLDDEAVSETKYVMGDEWACY